LKIAVVSPHDRQSEEIAGILRARSSSDEVDLLTGMPQVLAAGAGASTPDVLVFNSPLMREEELDQMERLSHVHPRLAFIVLSEQNSPEFLMRAMRAGVREVLPLPLNKDALCAAIQRIEEKRGSQSQTHGKVLAFISCKGGSGATFLATNLAYALATLKNKRVALIDLNLQFGDASLFVSDQKPGATIADISQQIHRLDASFLQASMLNVTPNFSVLAAPEDPAHANDVKPEHVDQLIKLVRRHYDFVILDLGRSLDAVSIHALDHADTIFPVLQTTLPYIRDGKRLLGVFRSLDYRKDKVQLIVNRHEKNGDIKLRDVEAAFGATDIRTIPNHYDAAAASVNQGVPVLKLAKSSPISKALQDFTESLCPEEASASSGWLSRVLKRA
jgi:pilus assembly protein CpaE